MWEEITKLFIDNKGGVFLLVLGAVITVCGFFIKHYFFSDNTNSDNTNINNNTNVTINNMPNSYISLEDYKKDLISKEKEITKKLTTAHNKEKIALEQELKTVQQNKNDLEKSYQTHIDNLK